MFIQQQQQAKCGNDWCLQKERRWNSLLQPGLISAEGGDCGIQTFLSATISILSCCSSSISIVFAAGISGSAFMEPIKRILWKHNSKIQIFAFGHVRNHLSCKESPCPTFPNQNHSQHWHESTYEIVSWLTCFWDVSYLQKYKYKCVNKHTYKHVYKYKHNLNIDAD